MSDASVFLICNITQISFFSFNFRLFLTNKKGYPVLPRALQQVIRRFVPLDVQVLIEGRARGHDITLYQSYIDHLWQQDASGDPLKQFAKGYEDYLQVIRNSQQQVDTCISQTFLF